MPSSIGWVVHDRDEHDHVNRILATLSQPEARDELGLGALRDSLSDLLFPGTSTIQTRLRYFLIVPWCYQALERTRYTGAAFHRAVEALERDLIAPLLDNDAAGVFGRSSGKRLKRLPSSVYWSGLHTWGIRTDAVSRSEYARNIAFYRKRARIRRTTDDGEQLSRGTTIWHPQLPPAPTGFPAELDLELTAEEATFLLECLQRTGKGTMLAWVARHAPRATCALPWQHPEQARFTAPIRASLSHAACFSDLMWGANLLYNVLLAREPAPVGQEDAMATIEAARLADLETWRSEVVDIGRLRAWDLTDLQRTAARASGHHVNADTWRFVRAWRDRVVATAARVADDATSGDLVKRREQHIKRRGGRSRFLNPSLRVFVFGQGLMLQL